MKRAMIVYWGLTLSMVGAAHAAELAKQKADQCFRSQDYQSFQPVSETAFNIRVNSNDYYRIDLQGACPEITFPGATLITRVRGSNLICNSLDWDLSIRVGGGPGDFATPCIVKSQRRLTSDEVKAMPPKERP